MEINTINGEWKQKDLFNELVQARDLVKKLKIHLDKSSPAGEVLLENAISALDRALSTTTRSGWDVAPTQLTARTSAMGSAESPPLKNCSPRSDDSDPHGTDILKRRKMQPTWTEKVSVGSGAGIEGSSNDCYSWRKYGQKDIHGAKHPRSYYRCTYRNNQGCLATRQVQRSSEDPSVYDVTYRGKHSCLQASHLQTKHNQCKNQSQDHQEEDQKPEQSQEGLFENFGKGLRIKTEDELLLDSQKLSSSSSSFSFPSSTTPVDCVKMENCNFLPFDRNYFSSSYHVQLNGQDTNTIHTSNHRQSDFDDAVLLDLVELNQYSPFDYFHP
ncbi:hypothetical protein C5167_035122 [Papaver somniferum]|uniref:WRKY domain-containing protein n=2 Tax=Papaver somniferum TaxID=3469 RepID=A0A4Y7KHX4_PAPSO|nr:probable WRKY transcription factor 53 [Papaver somniferum]RZC71950.1 hypothetical protein C5167_035122 [Papaver somniferum]